MPGHVNKMKSRRLWWLVQVVRCR